MATLFALAVLLLTAQTQPPPADTPPREGTGLILGRVVDGASGQPISGVTVSLGGSPTLPSGAFPIEPTAPRTLTAGDGYFVFRGVRPGSYSISANKGGFLPGAFGRRRPDGLAQLLVLTDGQRVGDITIPMWRVAAVSGVVVDEAGEPIPGVNVRAYRRAFIGGRARLRQAGGANTDDRGAYRIWSLSPGDYIIGVESATVSVPTEVMTAFRSASDGDDPARRGLAREMATVGAMIGGYTNVSAGNIVVSGRAGSGGALMGDGQFAYPTTFYPAATVAAQARAITVASGEDRSGIDIPLRPIPAVRVSGIATTPEGPAKYTAVRLVAAGAELLATDLDTVATITDASGAFTFVGVPAGQYTVTMLQEPPPPLRRPSGTGTMVQMGGATVGTSFSTSGPEPLPDGPTYFESMPLAVGVKDVTNVALTLKAAGRISGRVEFEGSAQRPADDALQRFSVWVDPASGAPARMNRGVVDKDGTFRTAGVAPGRYYLRVGGTVPPWTLKSATYQGRDVADTPIDISGGNVAGVVLTFTDSPAELSGSVTADGRPDTTATVVMFPTDVESWIDTGTSARRIRVARATSAGTFSIRSVPAGNYYVVAMPDDAAGDWQDPKVLESYVPAATQVRIEDGEKKTVTLRTAGAR